MAAVLVTDVMSGASGRSGASSPPASDSPGRAMLRQLQREVAEQHDRELKALPFEVLRGCFTGPVEDGYQGPPLHEALASLADDHWQSALLRLVSFSAVAVHRIAQFEERHPLEVLDDMIPRA